MSETRKGAAIVDLLGARPDQAVLFTRFRATLEYMSEVLAEHGIACETFHGGMTAAAKSAALDSFRAGARALLSTDVGAEGLDLQFCHLLVNVDLPWNPMRIEQRIGRLHRFGQTSEVQVFNLCAAGTVEERLLDVLARRVHLFELVVGEMDMVLGNLADERGLEERILALYAGARCDDEIRGGFDALADDLVAARGHYERARRLDDALFGQDFEA